MTHTASKVLLVEDRRCEQTEPGATVVKRYRLARLRLDGRPAGADPRYEHLERVND